VALGLATATLVGAILGWSSRVSAVILVVAALVIGGMFSGFSITQIGLSVLLLEVGYIVSSFLRVSTIVGPIGVTRPVQE
jgi:hypothetical protein